MSLVYRHRESDHAHCSGIESLFLVPSQKCLFTASRDSTIKRWSVGAGQPALDANFEGHADWVNDIVVIQDLLVSCSNDKTVRMWSANSPGVLLSTLTMHSDYVTALASSSGRNMVASAGLRGDVFLIDLATAANIRLYPKQQQAQQQPQQQPQQQQPASSQYMQTGPYGASPREGADDGPVPPPTKGSMYALAMNPAGTVLAGGGIDHLIRVWDPRTSGKIAKLRGHTDNVRSLVLNADGTQALSGSSDGTIKLWDIGMQRCIQSFSVHSDSVWCLKANESFTIVYSGGRDRCVYRTQLTTRVAELLLCEQQPVRSIALDPSESGLWVATPSSSVSKYLVPRDLPTPVSDGKSFTAGRARYLGSSPNMRARASMDKRPRDPAASGPICVIKGVPGIVLHKVMTDRRHVLTKDTDGNVALWDVLTGGVVDSYGKVDFDTKERELFEARSMPSWFTADVRLGQLCISLEPPSCFLAEEYALMLGYPNVSDDYKVNFGKLVLDGAFAKWRKRQLQQQQQQPQHAPPPGAVSPSGTLVSDDGQPVYPELWPRYWEPGAVPPAVMCQSATGQQWRRLISHFTGSEVEPDEVPTWVADVVLRQASVTPKEAKCAFVLLPVEGSNLPSLMQSKLNAPRILQVHKVANYCVSKLADQGVVLELFPVYARRPKHMAVEPSEAHDKPFLELLCNGVGVPYEMSLASVKKYIWRKSDDLIFNYRVRDPHNPAPLPVVTPTNS